VVNAESNYVLSLLELAEELGVGHRVHTAPFVKPNDVVPYLSEASVGIIPIVSSKMNHQIALPNKLFEYLHARLPLCVSDNRAMVDFVTETGSGEWFDAEDPASLAEAVTRVLADRDKYVDAFHENPILVERFSWGPQAEELIEVYREVLAEPDLRIRQIDTGEAQAVDEPADPPASLAIGPLNQAGQGNMWALGLVRHIPDVNTSVIMLDRPEKLQFPASDKVAIADWWDPTWRAKYQSWIIGEFTHVLIESGSSFLGGRRGVYFNEDIDTLRAANVTPALVFHGSDIRSPEIHRKLMATSPFGVGDDFSQGLEVSTSNMLSLVGRFDGAVFVSTKDLLDYVPTAEWLPLGVDTATWFAQPLRLGRRRLIVASTFTNRQLKGADHVDAVCQRLSDEGLIEYRRYANVPPGKMPSIISDIDVLIDGVVLGMYGVTSVEGMATGRVVLANIDRVIDKPGERPPIVNVNPSNLSDVLVDILERPEHYQEIAERGPGFVQRYHDGRYSSAILARFLGLDLPGSCECTDLAEAVELS
jgi:glycosyltransferase involved in cell wall biosynthesis